MTILEIVDTTSQERDRIRREFPDADIEWLDDDTYNVGVENEDTDDLVDLLDDLNIEHRFV